MTGWTSGCKAVWSVCCRLSVKPLMDTSMAFCIVLAIREAKAEADAAEDVVVTVEVVVVVVLAVDISRAVP